MAANIAEVTSLEPMDSVFWATAVNKAELLAYEFYFNLHRS